MRNLLGREGVQCYLQAQGTFPNTGVASDCRSGFVATRRGRASTGDAEEPPLSRYALELVLAAVGELDSRAGNEVDDPARGEHLARTARLQRSDGGPPRAVPGRSSFPRCATAVLTHALRDVQGRMSSGSLAWCARSSAFQSPLQ